uniref:Uncharacterized protein n=1 Tax=Anguilla anguilla TaxID=7936 RepID=A0A0E9X3Y3_ANGAN
MMILQFFTKQSMDLSFTNYNTKPLNYTPSQTLNDPTPPLPPHKPQTQFCPAPFPKGQNLKNST